MKKPKKTIGSRERTWSYDGAFTYYCGKIFDILLLGILWIICCLPVVTIGVSTAALYYAMVKCVKNDTGYVAHEFFHSFRTNLKDGIILGLIFASLIFLMQLNIGILMHKTDSLFGMFFMCFYGVADVYLIIMALYAFPALSRFDMSVGWIIKISLYMVVRYFLYSIVLVIIFAMGIMFVWKIPMLIFIVPGPICFLMSEFLESVLKKHSPE